MGEGKDRRRHTTEMLRQAQHDRPEEEDVAYNGRHFLAGHGARPRRQGCRENGSRGVSRTRLRAPEFRTGMRVKPLMAASGPLALQFRERPGWSDILDRVGAWDARPPRPRGSGNQ